MYCANCGCKVKEGAKFCVECGSPCSAPLTKEQTNQPIKIKTKKSKKRYYIIGVVIIMLIIAIVCMKKNGSTTEPENEYSALPDWSNYDCYDRVIQVDDLLLAPGCKASEILDQVSNSVNNYKVDIDTEQLMSYKEDTMIAVYKNRKEVFDIYVANYISEDKSIPLKDCIVYSISPYKIVSKYGAIGLMPSDLRKMTYEEIKDYVVNYFDSNDFEIKENKTEINNQDAIAIVIESTSRNLPYKNTDWAGIQLKGSSKVTVYVDNTTQKGMYAERRDELRKSEKSESCLIKSYDELTEEEYKELIEITRNESIDSRNYVALWDDEKVKEMTLIGTGLKPAGDDEIGGLTFIYEVQLENGSCSYMAARPYELSRNPITGDLSYGKINTSLTFTNVEDIISQLEDVHYE